MFSCPGGRGSRAAGPTTCFPSRWTELPTAHPACSDADARRARARALLLDALELSGLEVEAAHL